MNEIKTLLEIEKTSKTTDKIKLLQENDSKELRELLIYAYDTFKVFKIKHLDYEKSTEVVYRSSLHQQFINLLDMLMVNNINDNIRKTVKNFLEKCPQPQQDIYYRILIKDLTIGIGAKSVNKAFGKGTIIEFKIMKDEAYTDQNLERPLIVQKKYDGYRCLIVKDKLNITCYTSNGKVIPLKNIQKVLSKIPESFVLDGELVSTTRTGTSTICNRLIKGNDKVDDSNLTFYAFDYLNLKEFTENNFTTICEDRLVNLESFCMKYKFKQIKPAKSYISKDTDTVINLYKQARMNYEEGIIVKDLKGVYETKRSKNWLKLKAINSCTLKIIDIIKYTKKDVLGSLVCTSKDKKITVNVGSGFTDEERKELWNPNIIGKCIEVIYNELQSDKDGNWYLFLPRFKEIRYEKTEPDDFEKIMKEYM